MCKSNFSTHLWYFILSTVICTVHPQNVRFQNVRFQNIWFQNVRFQNVRFTKRKFYKTSGFKTSCFKTSIEIKAWHFVNLTFCKPDVSDVMKPGVFKPDVLWVYHLYSHFHLEKIINETRLQYKLICLVCSGKQNIGEKWCNCCLCLWCKQV
jgi:hypothetical protein